MKFLYDYFVFSKQILGKFKAPVLGKEERTSTDKKRERRKKKHLQHKKRVTKQPNTPNTDLIKSKEIQIQSYLEVIAVLIEHRNPLYICNIYVPDSTNLLTLRPQPNHSTAAKTFYIFRGLQ